MMNCHCGHLDHLSCLGKPHLITVREAQDGQRLLYRQGTYYLPFSLLLFPQSHKHILICVSLAVLQAPDENTLGNTENIVNNYMRTCFESKFGKKKICWTLANWICCVFLGLGNNRTFNRMRGETHIWLMFIMSRKVLQVPDVNKPRPQSGNHLNKVPPHPKWNKECVLHFIAYIKIKTVFSWKRPQKESSKISKLLLHH